MSLARAFTNRRVKRSIDASAGLPPPIPTRTTARESVKMNITRGKISAPVALLSTTNMLSYNAPDIDVYRQQKQAAIRQVSSSSSSTHSNSTGDDSDRSSVSSQKNDSFITDSSSVDDSPIERSPSPEENHLSRYFPSTKTVRRSVSTSEMSLRVSATETPAIPRRAPSHSKRAHEASLARKRSMQTWERESVNSSVLSTPSSTSSFLQSMQEEKPLHIRSTSAQSNRSNSTAPLRSSQSLRDSNSRTSLDIFRAGVEANHPFGKELEQLNEVAEEFVDTVRDAEWEADAHAMKLRGLVRYCANDYLTDISPLFGQTGLWAPVVSTDGGFF